MRCSLTRPPPKKEGRRGRPKKYGDRFSARNPEAHHLPCIASAESHRTYAGVAYVKALNRLVNSAILNGRR
ncbi:MAG: hypothetical protein RMJ33_11010 [Saprospiraceae bacterium]|nr:hypothetical protein [Saprospiraceae bacterium]MDW8230357.1 hypothetical protein [Saprospiraceae bacterium]